MTNRKYFDDRKYVRVGKYESKTGNNVLSIYTNLDLDSYRSERFVIDEIIPNCEYNIRPMNDGDSIGHRAMKRDGRYTIIFQGFSKIKNFSMTDVTFDQQKVGIRILLPEESKRLPPRKFKSTAVSHVQPDDIETLRYKLNDLNSVVSMIKKSGRDIVLRVENGQVRASVTIKINKDI